jgi:hypothetical protein
LFTVGLAVCLAACQIEGPDTGAAAVHLRFSPPPFPGAGTRGVLSGVVDSVRVTVSHGGEQLVAETFDYEGRTGTVSDIPVGDGRVFLVQALAGQDVVYHGTKSNITIAKNQTVTIAIDMEPAYTPDNDVYAPAAVEDLSGQASGADVNLGWTATGDDGRVGQAASYDLRWSESTISAANFDSATPVTGVPSPGASGSTEQFTVTGLSPGGTYHFVLKVDDDRGNRSAVSNEAIVTTGGVDTTAPGASILAVYSVTDTTVTLSWTASGDDGSAGTATVYDVRYLAGSTAIDDTNWATVTEAAGEPTPQAAGSAETFTVTGLTEGQQYYFGMKTGDEVPNWSMLSNSVDATPADVIAPAKVTDLRSPSSDDTSVTLDWTAPGDDDDIGTADHYDIRYLQGTHNESDFDTNWATATIDTNPPAPQVAGGTDTTTIGGLTTGATYTFALKAYDEVPNESPISNVVTLQVGIPDTDPPADVIDLAAVVAGETAVRLAWTAPAEDVSTGLNTATAYDIRYLEGATPIGAANWAAATEVTGEPAPQAPGSAETFDVTGLTPDTQYHFALKTMDEQNNWSVNVSNSPTATPTDIVSPEDIVDLAMTAFDEVSISLQWTAPGDDGNVGTVTAYDIRFAEAPIAGDAEWTAATQFGDLPTAPQAAGSTETVTIDTGLTQGHHYYIRMKTTDDKGNESGMSNQVDQLLPCPACPTVSGFRPPAAPVGAIVSIDGTNFGAAQGTGTVEFGATVATVLSWSDTAIVAAVPAGSTGTMTVTLTNDSTFSTTAVFDVTPHIDAITPNTIALPAGIVITGSGFGSTVDTITFTGTAPVFTVTDTDWTDTQINVDVTSDVVTGPVTVTVGSHDSNTPILTINGDERGWTAPVIWNSDTPGSVPSVFPRAATESNGDVQVVWTETDPLATDLEILGEARVGGSLVGFFNLSDTSSNDSSLPEIAGDGAGTYHLVCLDAGVADSAILYTSGKHDTWSAVETVAGESMDARPAVGLLAGGTVITAWSTGGAVRYNTRSPAGVWGTAGDVLTAGTNAGSVSGAVDPSGNFHIVFINGTDLVHAWFDGGAWNDGGTVAVAGTGTLVSLASDGLGVLHALWWDTTLKYAYRDASGWAAGTAPTATAAAPEALDLVADAGDSLHAVVEDSTGTYAEIHHFQKPPAGAWSVTPEILSDGIPDIDSKQPCLLVNPDLTITVLWSEDYRVRMVSWE